MEDGFFIGSAEGEPKRSGLPDASTLARLISNVTGGAAGTTFVPAKDDQARGLSICGRMVLLPIPGPRDISVVLSCDVAGGRALGAAIWNRPADQLTREMIDDAIAELLNMVAGQIQAELEIDQRLGLPRRTSLAELSQGGGVSFNDSILLTSESFGDLKLWVFERVARPDGAETGRSGIGKQFRSLFGKLAQR